MAQQMVNDEEVPVDVFGGCPSKGQPPFQTKTSLMTAPISQASMDPSTPNLSHLPEPFGSPHGNDISCGGFKFMRTYSEDSTVVPESAPMTPLMTPLTGSFQPDPFHESSQPFGSLSLDPGFAPFPFSRTVSCESGVPIEERAEHPPPAEECFLTPFSQEVTLANDCTGDSAQKVEQLEKLLEEVKDLYNSKYPLDHLDDAGHEAGHDADGLFWVKYTGQGRGQVEKLQDLLQEVKGLYNAKYPLDHAVDVEREIGYDADGLLWVKTTGQSVARGQVEQLEHLLEEVKGLYNQKYPLDHVDEADREVGFDADGLLWVRYTGQGPQTIDAKVERLQSMLEEVKGLYNATYPLDHVDAEDCDLGTDADGLLWVRYTGDGVETRDTQVGDLEELLDEVKRLYNEKYPLDHVDDDVGQEVGRDADGLLWVQYTGQGVEETKESKVEALESLLREVKDLYNERYPLNHVDNEDREVSYDADGLLWVGYTGRGAEARELKIEELLELLEEVKGLYNDKYILDHVDDVGCEVGRDADGLLWVQHTGQGTESQRSKVDDLEDLLSEVKSLYNARYPHDHVEDYGHEVGRDEDGLLWVQYTGHRSETHQEKTDELHDLLEEVKGLYNKRFPLDHVDDVGCEMGHDADGLLWVKHTGQGAQTRSAKIDQLEDLLEEVKGLYNQKYPHDHVSNIGHEVGYDADGLLWVKYSGRAQVDELQDLLEEVKRLYNEKYPMDHVNDVDREVGCDSDGLVWSKYTGQGVERSQVERLEDLLEEVKCLYNERYPEDHADDAGHEVGYDADGLLWVQFTGHGVVRCQVAKLEDLLAEVKELYNSRYPEDHVDDVALEVGTDADGLSWVQYTGQGPKTWEEKVEKLEDLLGEVQDLYNERYPEDHVDDAGREVGTDADGLLWVRDTGLSVKAEHQQRDVQKLEDLLQEVKDLYNERHPQDHVDDLEREVGIDADGLLWVKYTGNAIEARTQRMDELLDLLEEVKSLYGQRYPLDSVDDIGHEAGVDAEGLHWMSYTGQGTAAGRERKVTELEALLEEVRGLYNERYALDHVDDEGTELGCDSDGLLWVQCTGHGVRVVQQVAQLEDLLEEVKQLYCQRYPLDEVDDTGREVGYDAVGLLWVQHTGPGIAADGGQAEDQPEGSKPKVDRLHDLLSEVKRLYNEKYPLDSVDDLGAEAGYDADGLLWVKRTGLCPVASAEATA